MTIDPILILHLPDWLAEAWRVTNWLAACGLIGSYTAILIGSRRPSGVPPAYAVLLAAVIVGLVRGILVQVERWEQPIDLAGAPLFSLYIVLLIVSLIKVTHDMRIGRLLPPFRRGT